MAEVKQENNSSLVPILVVVAILFLFLLFGSETLFDVKFINIEVFFKKLLGVVGFIFSRHTWVVAGSISAFFSFFFIVIIVFSLVRLREMQLTDKRHIDHNINIALALDQKEEDKKNLRWLHVLELIESPNESDWRLAIIEADAMLDDLLKDRGYYGDTLGDRLKSASGGGFTANNVSNAFEAHNIRNKIAHEGTNFALSQMDSRRIMRLYETVFEEFGVI